ncbi:MAG: DUF1634 domain-containing protein [Bacillota bacterium]
MPIEPVATAEPVARRRGEAAGLEMEVVISRILQLGVLAAAAVIGLGVLLWIVQGNTGYQAAAYPTRVGDVIAGALQGRPAAVIQAGLLVLLLTPVFRVAASVAIFAAQRDRTFTLVTLAVLALLVGGFLLGREPQ